MRHFHSFENSLVCFPFNWRVDNVQRSWASVIRRLILSKLLIITAITLAQALVTSHLDCCNSLLTGFLQNSPILYLCLPSIPTSFIFLKLCADHVTSLLRSSNVPQPLLGLNPNSSVCCCKALHSTILPSSSRIFSHFSFMLASTRLYLLPVHRTSPPPVSLLPP